MATPSNPSKSTAASSLADASGAMPPLDLQPLLRSALGSIDDGAVALRLSDLQWQSLAALLQRRALAPGERLMARGERGDSAFVLEVGGLQVFVDRGGPRPTHRIAVLQPGAVVGEPALFGTCMRMATVEATCDSVVWGLSAGALEPVVAADPMLGLELLRAAGAIMARRMRANLDRGLPVA